MPRLSEKNDQSVANGNLSAKQNQPHNELSQTSTIDSVNNHQISTQGVTLGYESGPPSTSWQIALQGNYAYVADYSTGMVVVDVSNTNSPTALATFSPGVTRSTSVAVKGNYAFFVNGNNGLYVLDVNNPSSPSQVYFNQQPGRFVLESALSGNYLYLVAEVNTGLNIVDISTPTSASQVGNFPISGQTQGIAVSGNYAYLANTGSGLYIVNVSNPASPAQVAHLATPGGAYGVAVSGNYAYVAAQGAGLHIINISNPASPSIVATYNTPGSALKVAMQGNYAVVADNTSLQIIDVSNPTTPVLAGRSSKPCISATVSGNYVYAGCGGLQIFKTIPGPVLTNNQLTVSEGQTVTLTTSNLNATYADVGASGLTYTISNFAGGGRFELSSNLGVAITQFTQQQVNAGVVRFVDDGNEVAPSFRVSVSDGLMFTQPTNAAINYTPVNDAPVLSSATTTALTFNENGIAQVVNPTLTVSDVDSANLASATVTITSYVSGQDVLLLPTNPQNGISASFNTSTGVLTLTGSSSVANYQTALRTVTYQNTSDNPSTTARSISIVVNDGALNSNAVSRSVTINKIPVLVSNSLAIGQAQTVVLSTSQLSASDDTASASALQFTVSNVQQGEFRLNGVAATSFTQQDINDSKVSFVHDGTAVAPSYTVVVSDGQLTSAPQTASITFNKIPVLVSNSLAIGQAQTVVLSTSQLSASDDTASASALQFTVSNVQQGEFRLNGVAATSFTQQDINDSKVSFVHDGTAVAPSYTVVVSDGQLTSAPQTASITFNKIPVLVSNSLAIGQAQTVVLSTSQLSASDDTASASALQFTVSNVQQGEFRLNGVAATSFTQQDINDSKVSFVHDGTAVAPSYTVVVSDGQLTSAPQTASITFNKIPVLVSNSLAIGQAQTVVLSTSQLSASDDTASASALQFTVSNVQQGEFRLNGVAATSFTQQDINDSKVSFVHDGTAVAPSYTVVVSDGQLTSAPQTASITFNKIPVLVSNSLAIGQAQTVVLSASQLSASDDTASANDLLFTVSNVQRGEFRLNGVAATSFTQQNINDSQVSFVHDGTTTAPSYTVRVSDSQLTSRSQSANIAFKRLPVLSSDPHTVSYFSRTAPVPIDEQLSIQADDSPLLTHATVSISQGLVATEDELSVATPTGLSATYESTTGVLQVTGNATVADYQQCLRQVAYRSLADVPTTQPRTISFSVFDGELASQPVNASLSVIQVNRAPQIIKPLSELAVRVNQPFSLSVADTFHDSDNDELTLGLLPADGQTLPDWLSFNASQQVLAGTARTPGRYNFTLFANDTSHAQTRMPMTLVARVVASNAAVLGTALGVGLGGGFGLLCCLGILLVAGLVARRQWQLQQEQALTRQPHLLADLLRKELNLKGVADFNTAAGKMYVEQVNYLITYDEALFHLYIRCSNDKQLSGLAKELAKLIRLHFKQENLTLRADQLRKETPRLLQLFHKQDTFFTKALNRKEYQDLLLAPLELEERLQLNDSPNSNPELSSANNPRPDTQPVTGHGLLLNSSDSRLN